MKPMKYSAILKTVKNTINTVKTGSMVRSTKKLSNNKDNIRIRARVAISEVDFPVLILGKARIFQIFSRICSVEQEVVSEEAREEALPGNLKGRMYMRN